MFLHFFRHFCTFDIMGKGVQLKNTFYVCCRACITHLGGFSLPSQIKLVIYYGHVGSIILEHLRHDASALLQGNSLYFVGTISKSKFELCNFRNP